MLSPADGMVKPVGANPQASAFFQTYLAGPIIIALFVGWKLYSRIWKWYVPAHEMDITSGRRSLELDPDDMPPKKTWKNAPMRVVRALF